MPANAKATVAPIVLSAVLLWANLASAQTAGLGCTKEKVAGAARHILHCQKGVTIIAEDAARYSLLDRNKDQLADGVSLRRKALLLEVSRGLGGSGFIVVTPQAIAAVRGTKWAVDVQGGKSSVFVVSGTVNVKRASAGSGVDLRAGQGVDVDRGGGELTVKRWPQARVSALLARFGQ